MSTIFPRSVMCGDVIVREGQRLWLVTLDIEGESMEVALPLAMMGLASEVSEAMNAAGAPPCQS